MRTWFLVGDELRESLIWSVPCRSFCDVLDNIVGTSAPCAEFDHTLPFVRAHIYPVQLILKLLDSNSSHVISAPLRTASSDLMFCLARSTMISLVSCRVSDR